MGNQLELLAAEALKLSTNERAEFAQRLLASLDEDETLSDEWEQELDRRINEIENGTVQLMPITDAIAQVKASLR